MNRPAPRRQTTRHALSAVLPFVLVAAWAVAADAAGTGIADKQNALAAVRSRIEAVSKSIEASQAERDALARDLQSTERKIASIRAELRTLEKQTAEQNRRVEDARQEIAASNRSLGRRNESLRKQIRAAYVIGRQGRTQLLLSQNDVQKIGRVLVYYDYLQRAQSAAIDGIRDRLNELESLSERMQLEISRMDDLQKRHKKSLAQLRETYNERKGVLAKLRERIADEQGELKRLRADEESISDLIERLQDTLSDLPPDAGFSDRPFASLRGKLPWPLRGSLIARYGEAKAGGKLTWKGHWIGAQDGTPVRAVARGRVVYVGWMHRYGLIVLLEHEGGYYSLYGHAQAANVAVGDAIRAGQVIASAGSTGGHDRTGVYFELRKGTDAIDPRHWLGR